MKSLIALIVTLVLALTAKTWATDYTISQAANTLNYSTNNASLLTTNILSFTNSVESADYHHFSLTSSTNLNGFQACYDFSDDAANWIAYGTNAVANTGGTLDTNFIGKHTYFRVRTYGTNGVFTITYLGGR